MKQIFPSTRGVLEIELHTAVGPNTMRSHSEVRFSSIRTIVNGLLKVHDITANPVDLITITFLTTASKPKGRG